MFQPPQDEVFSLCLINCGSSVLPCVINSPEDLNVVHVQRGVGRSERAVLCPLSRTLSCLTRAEETFKCGCVFVLP